MKFLAIDTSSDACSVALQIDGTVVSDHRVVSRQHGALVLPMVDALMAQAGCKAAELDALIYGRGPGSFTGVRIGRCHRTGYCIRCRYWCCGCLHLAIDSTSLLA